MTSAWAEIVNRYRERAEAGVPLRGMLDLVEQIAASRYAQALHAWTSVQDLCIAQEARADSPYDGPYLRVTPRFDGTVEFRYVDTFIESRQWHRIVKEEDAFTRLERFIDQLHWVGWERKA
jgi:hypothetical protein